MKDEQRLKVLEDELKVLKNEIKAILVDLREQYLNIQNPFNYKMLPGIASPDAGISPKEQEAKQAQTGENQTATGTSNNCSETKVAGNQTTMSELPKTQQDDKIKNLKVKPEVAGQWITDMADIVDPRGMSYLRHSSVGENGEESEQEESTESPALHKRSRAREEQNFSKNSGKADIVAIAGLTQWIDQATAKLGKERTEALVEMSFAMGRLPIKVKDALIRMIHLSKYESNNQTIITASDYLAILAQLENLLAGSYPQDSALLSILSMMKESHNG